MQNGHAEAGKYTGGYIIVLAALVYLSYSSRLLTLQELRRHRFNK